MSDGFLCTIADNSFVNRHGGDHTNLFGLDLAAKILLRIHPNNSTKYPKESRSLFPTAVPLYTQANETYWVKTIFTICSRDDLRSISSVNLPSMNVYGYNCLDFK
jgi:hypothetical protein